MGVIKKVLYRGEVLGRPRHRNLFLDMEENIHIHYRDLRIELSRAEFEDIARIFARQSAELLDVIQRKDYRDGRLPNANQDDVRIWTESRLPNDVRYHPQRLSLEDCGDGYHLHYRNYKILLDRDEFRQLAAVFRSLDLEAAYASGYEEVLRLLEENDVDFSLDAGNVPGETLAIAVARYHMPKVRDIFNYIGFKAEPAEGAERRYRSPRLLVIARPDARRGAGDFRRLRGMNATVRLVDHLSAHGPARLDPDELNAVKCQVIDLYYALSKGRARDVDLDPQSWLYASGNRQVVFPFRAVEKTPGPAEAERMYRAWAALLNGLQLGFVKPSKEVLPPGQQAALRARIDETILREVASHAAVRRIWIMGSALRGDLGRYRVPFVHGKLVKLGSDVDILVEIDPDLEGELPASWRLHLPRASNHCAVYHVADVSAEGKDSAETWRRQHGSIPFQQHLVDAYVHFPSRGFAEEKDAFLRKFSAQVLYDRERDGVRYQSETEARIAARLSELHGFPPGVAVAPMAVSTENRLYAVRAESRSWVLKLLKVSGNYRSARVPEHAFYEERLVGQLLARGIPTAAIRGARGGERTIEGHPALLFERIPGEPRKRPEYAIERVAAALAHVHAVQMERPLDLDTAFSYDDACMIWLPAFEGYLARADLPAEVARAAAALAPVAKAFFPGEARAALFARSHAVHCHGDVTPKNVFSDVPGEARFFDFNNAFFGARMADLADGAFEFALAEKYIHLADFARYDAFVGHYAAASPLSATERDDLGRWRDLVGIIKFAKEVRVMLERPKENLRRKRALAVAAYLLSASRA